MDRVLGDGQGSDEKIGARRVRNGRYDLEVAVVIERARLEGVRSVRLRFCNAGLAIDNELDTGIRHGRGVRPAIEIKCQFAIGQDADQFVGFGFGDEPRAGGAGRHRRSRPVIMPRAGRRRAGWQRHGNQGENSGEKRDGTSARVRRGACH